MPQVENKLQVLGIELPPPKVAVANYQGCKRSGDVLYVSGRVSDRQGEVGGDVSKEEAKGAAREALVTQLAIIKDSIGDLDR